MSWSVYAAVFAAVTLGATVQISVGMGYGLVAAPLVRIVHPDLLPGPVVMAGMFISLVLASRESRRGDISVVIPAFAGRLVGIGIAIVLLANLSERGLTLLIGVLVLTFAALQIAGLRIPVTTRSMGGAGVASGIGGSIASLGGAPIGLLYSQHTDARDFRGPMGVYLSLGGVMTVALLAIAGEIDGEDALLGLSLLPPVATGAVLARLAKPYVDRGALRPIVLGLSIVSAVVLVISEVS